jgi:hypothetical protein
LIDAIDERLGAEITVRVIPIVVVGRGIVAARPVSS